jgi:hypothetical protein
MIKSLLIKSENANPAYDSWLAATKQNQVLEQACQFAKRLLVSNPLFNHLATLFSEALRRNKWAKARLYAH